LNLDDNLIERIDGLNSLHGLKCLSLRGNKLIDKSNNKVYFGQPYIDVKAIES